MAAFISSVYDSTQSLVDTLRGNSGSSSSSQHNQRFALLVIASIFIIVPMDIGQLSFAVLGALAYFIFQKLQESPNDVAAKKTKSVNSPLAARKVPNQNATTSFTEEDRRRRRQVQTADRNIRQQKTGTAVSSDVQLPADNKSSQAPVAAPKFVARGFSGEVEEFLGQILPTAQSDRAVERLAKTVKNLLSTVLPEAEVLGFASADLSRGKAFGVAVPDVDIVINVCPTTMANRLASRLPDRRSKAIGKMDAKKLQKSAVRTCTDRLVNAGGFKFRRSAFRGDDPKVTLLAPAELGIFSEAVPMDLHVNSSVPLHSAALMTECGQISMQAKGLLVLVRRWAKDRGICHHPKGFFTPYIWSLLCIYFMQVTDDEDGTATLPPLEEFQATAALMDIEAKKAKAATSIARKEESQKRSVAELFRSFMDFYAGFDWAGEAICPLLGKQDKPSLNLPIHIIEDASGSTKPGPNIEDPFNRTSNLGACTNQWSFDRMKEEIVRAKELLSKSDASLSDILEPWTPPGQGLVEADEEDCREL
eukprot:TRINITY_DN3416_c3_g1_i2.p1 TRINITY_DN3416_c3_g1~~TRINITY_DN3416_c3_g1_i2.p1  ORF type:complete len:534 (+),score=124.19 TRINITY_DN3416_c3_g1_i2:118-1719(+)